MKLRLPAVAVPALLSLCLCCGCAVRSSRTITGSGDFGATPPGPAAVLRVTAAPSFDPRTGETAWGMVNTPNVEKRFAEFLADEAEDDGGMDVIPPFESEDRLLKAGLKPTLQPDDAQLQQFAAALGCASYLTADVQRSRLEYRFFWSWSTVTFDVACYAPGRREPLWQARVCRVARGKTDRETLALALKEMFQWLRKASPAETAPGCEE